MRLRKLSLHGFRNLCDRELDVPAEGVAILGRNAQGKTNLLEAIAYLETFRSFRGASDDRLVRFGEDVFRLAGELRPDGTDGGARTVSAGYQVGSRTKRVRVDGEVQPRLGDAIGVVGTVLFTPRDVRLVTDGPAERRRFLDIVLSLNDADYLAALQRFRQSLAQRNAALREPGAPVGAWEGAMLRWGAEVTRARAAWVAEATEGFARHYQEVFGSASAFLRYEPSIFGVSGSSDSETVLGAYEDALEAAREAERRRGVTLVGPHRDELKIEVGLPDGETVDAREYGSGGQRRTAALALRLAEAETLRRRRRREPILLLDDVFAELDEERSTRLLELLDRAVPGQVILTAPKEGDVRFRRDVLPRWSIEAGEVTP